MLLDGCPSIDVEGTGKESALSNSSEEALVTLHPYSELSNFFYHLSSRLLPIPKF